MELATPNLPVYTVWKHPLNLILAKKPTNVQQTSRSLNCKKQTLVGEGLGDVKEGQ